ncbi:MAG: hypothetical protein CMJ78_12290 [Planctomycetaceae bacterium]|nr:hypothetical protein [Planctomycetaceae bacterium]
MNETAQCPRCQQELVNSTNEDSGSCQVCSGCAGVFVPAEQADAELFANVHPVESSEDNAPLCCPGCGNSMQEFEIGKTLIDRCDKCHGVWLDFGEVLSPNQSEDAVAMLGRYLMYSLTVPERTFRSTIGLAAGAAREVADFLVPQAFQSSKTYEVAIRNSLRFLTQDVAGVKADPTDDTAQPQDDYVARKTVGNFVDLAGLATLHVSPLWLLAIVSDVAYGSKSYVNELANELKAQGLIDEDSTINHVDDVLKAIQDASGKAAGLFDTPPLSTEQLKETLDETREAVTSAEYTKVLPEAELKKYWEEMRDVANRENVSLLGVSGAMTMHSLGKVKTVSQGALTGIMVAGGLFNRHVIGHYVDSLTSIHERGYYQTLQESATPYVDAIWTNFEANRPTLTEEVVTGRAISKLYTKVSGWFSRSEEETETEQDKGASQETPPV